MCEYPGRLKLFRASTYPFNLCISSACCKYTQSPENNSVTPGEYFLLSLAAQSSLLQMSYEKQEAPPNIAQWHAGMKVGPAVMLPSRKLNLVAKHRHLKTTTEISPFQRRVLWKYHLPWAERGSLWMKFCLLGSTHGESGVRRATRCKTRRWEILLSPRMAPHGYTRARAVLGARVRNEGKGAFCFKQLSV